MRGASAEMSCELLPIGRLPEGFAYPPEFLHLLGLGIRALDPWRILEGDQLVVRSSGLAARYPDRALVPFAVRTDRDDVACWDLDKGPRAISVIDDFDTPGDEQLESFDEFNDWLRQAIEDLIDYEYDSGILPWP
ncbi:hypothetical protein [Acidipropionibacterium acidipropionici]|jgi:hypothetical protein|nr:hypothetical protein [Acidipropionibacterium acidipropionici]